MSSPPNDAAAMALELRSVRRSALLAAGDLLRRFRDPTISFPRCTRCCGEPAPAGMSGARWRKDRGDARTSRAYAAHTTGGVRSSVGRVSHGSLGYPRWDMHEGSSCMRKARGRPYRHSSSSGVPRTRLVACVYASRDRTASATWRKPHMSGRHGACGLRERAGTKAGRGTPEVGHGCGAHGGWWRRRLTECN